MFFLEQGREYITEEKVNNLETSIGSVFVNQPWFRNQVQNLNISSAYDLQFAKFTKILLEYDWESP